MPVQNVERLLEDSDDVFCRLNLSPDRGLLNGRHDDVGREREPRRLHLEGGLFRLRLQRFDASAVEPPDVGGITDGQLLQEKSVGRVGRIGWNVGYGDSRQNIRRRRKRLIEDRRIDRAEREIVRLNVLAVVGVENDLRRKAALLRFGVEIGDADRRFGGIERGVVFERVPNERIQRLRSIERPPVGGDVAPLGETLARARGSGLLARKLRRGDGRGRREIRPDRIAAGKQRAEKKKLRAATRHNTNDADLGFLCLCRL